MQNIWANPAFHLLLIKELLASRYGTMHVTATNIILWIRTLIKETMEEVSEIGEEHEKIEREARNYKVIPTKAV